MLALGATLPALHRSQFHSLPGGFYCYLLTSPFLCCIILANIMVEVFMEISSDSLFKVQSSSPIIPPLIFKSRISEYTLGAGPKAVCHQLTRANFTWNS